MGWKIRIQNIKLQSVIGISIFLDMRTRRGILQKGVGSVTGQETTNNKNELQLLLFFLVSFHFIKNIPKSKQKRQQKILFMTTITLNIATYQK